MWHPGSLTLPNVVGHHPAAGIHHPIDQIDPRPPRVDAQQAVRSLHRSTPLGGELLRSGWSAERGFAGVACEQAKGCSSLDSCGFDQLGYEKDRDFMTTRQFLDEPTWQTVNYHVDRVRARLQIRRSELETCICGVAKHNRLAAVVDLDTILLTRAEILGLQWRIRSNVERPTHHRTALCYPLMEPEGAEVREVRPTSMNASILRF
jgi:hypothetical protein